MLSTTIFFKLNYTYILIEITLGVGMWIYSLKKVYTIIISALILTSCATNSSIQLNVTDRTVMVPDFAPYDEISEIPFEFQENDDLRIGANIRYVKGLGREFFLLRLSITNLADSTLNTSPIVSLYNNNNFVVGSVSFSDFITLIRDSFEIDVPQNIYVTSNTYYNPGKSYNTAGRISNTTTGELYNYNATTTVVSPTGGFNEAFQRSFNQAYTQSYQENMARNRRAEGQKALGWTRTYWLKDNYEILPETSVGGVLYFNAPQNLPLRFNVIINGTEFNFTTKDILQE